MPLNSQSGTTKHVIEKASWSSASKYNRPAYCSRPQPRRQVPLHADKQAESSGATADRMGAARRRNRSAGVPLVYRGEEATRESVGSDVAEAVEKNPSKTQQQDDDLKPRNLPPL